MGLLSRHKKYLHESDLFYKSIGQVECPYFEGPVVFNSDGFHHLQFSADRERNKKEQLLKFIYLKYAPQILLKSGTVQEHRKTMEVGERKRYAKGERDMVEAEYWGFIAIVDANSPIRVKVIVKRVGNGNLQFWSIMPAQKRGPDAHMHRGSEEMLDG